VSRNLLSIFWLGLPAVLLGNKESRKTLILNQLISNGTEVVKIHCRVILVNHNALYAVILAKVPVV
jgi:hypothetical protein